MRKTSEHEDRVMAELKSVGVTWFGMRKFTIKYLPKVIHKNEHIRGVIYGRYTQEKGTDFNEGTLVATDLRVLFIDHKPGYTKADELTYDVVSGISRTTAFYSAVTLRTRLGDFAFRFVNPKCAAIFVSYVEERRLEAPANAR